MSMSVNGTGYTSERACRLGVLIGALYLSIGVAATGQESAPPPAEKVSPQEAYESTLKELERLEAVDAGELTATSMDELNKRLVVLQSTDPTHARLSYLYGRAYALAGRGKDAIEQLRRFVETREGRNEWEAHRRLGDLFVDEFPQLARGSYRRAAELKSNEPTILVGLSLCAYKVGQHDEAARLAQEAADADGGKTVRVASHLARMLIAKREWTDADRAATRAMELAEAQGKSQPGQRAPLRTLDAQCKLAVDLIQARIGEKAAGADDYLRLAGLFRKRNDLAAKLNLHECVRVLEAGVNAMGADAPPRLLQEYAALLAEVGRTEDAIAAFEKLLSLDPKNAIAVQQIEKLRSASAPGGG